MHRSTRQRLSALAIALSCVAGTAAQADDLVVRHNATGTETTFSMAEFEDLGLVSLKTETPWTDGMQHFEGVTGKAFLDAIDTKGETILAVALDDYLIEIPTEVFRNEPVIIASKVDGKRMAPSDKGPFWIMFDFDNAPVSRHSEYRNYSVWQLVEIEVE